MPPPPAGRMDQAFWSSLSPPPPTPPPPVPGRGLLLARRSPGSPPGSGRAMAPRLQLLRRAPPPSALGRLGDPVRCAAEASPWTGRSSGFPARREGQLAGDCRGASPLRQPRAGRLGKPLPCGRRSGTAEGTGRQFPFLGCHRAAPAEKTNLCRGPAGCPPRGSFPARPARRCAELLRLRWDAFVCRPRREC